MQISIEIRDNLYRDIEFFITSNPQLEESVEQYMLRLIEDGFYTEKYGDLNKIFGVGEQNKDFVKEESKNITENVKLETEIKESTTKSIENVIEQIEKDAAVFHYDEKTSLKDKFMSAADKVVQKQNSNTSVTSEEQPKKRATRRKITSK